MVLLHAVGSAFIVVCAAGYNCGGECTKAGAYIEREQTCCEHRRAAALLWLGLDVGHRHPIFVYLSLFKAWIHVYEEEKLHVENNKLQFKENDKCGI